MSASLVQSLLAPDRPPNVGESRSRARAWLSDQAARGLGLPTTTDIDWRTSHPSRFFPAAGKTWCRDAERPAAETLQWIDKARVQLAPWIATLPAPIEIVFFINGRAAIAPSATSMAADGMAALPGFENRYENWLSDPVAYAPPAARRPHLPRPTGMDRSMEWLNLALPSVAGVRFTTDSASATLVLVHVLTPASISAREIYAPLSHQIRVRESHTLHLFETTLDWSNESRISAHSQLLAEVKSAGELHHLRLEMGAGAEVPTATLNVARVELEADARYQSWGWTGTRSRWTRQESWIRLKGAGANAQLWSWVAPIHSGTHADRLVSVEHLAPNTTSLQSLKAIVGAKGSSSFAGRIFVSPEAQKTDAKQVCRSLLLAEGAQSQARPELEIHADDVKCSHGATIAQFDEEPLFYLRSRGIPPDAAKELMIMAFSNETLETLKRGPFVKTAPLLEAEGQRR
ncbi:MAG: SufD family Fe-S cluster assembly protein [Bdellovibrionota bacterium]